MSDTFDVVVIGGGPGGYNAAIRAGQLGLSSACIDKRGTFGGTCLNVGCIPSKALLFTSELFEKAEKDFAKLGVKTTGVSLDLAAMMAHKTKVVGELTRGVEFLLKKNKSEAIVGEARIVNPGTGHRDASRRHDAHAFSEEHRHRDGLGCGAASGRDSRRGNHRVVDRRIDAQIRAEAARGCRRRLYRARAWFGVAPARQRRDGCGIPRPHHAGARRRSGQAVSAHPAAAGDEIPALDESCWHRQEGREPEGECGGRRRRKANAGSRCRAHSDRPQALHRLHSASTKPA